MADTLNDLTRAKLDDYVSELYVNEDEVLKGIQAEAERQQMPAISVRPFEGRLLQFLVYSTNAKKVIEIGALAGYSGTWIARALPADGRLYTLEKSSKHAAVAHASFERAGVSGKVELLEGDAQDSLKKLASKGPFDLIFIDADKPGYPAYLAWSVENLRPGGMVAAHNAFRNGRVIAPESDDDRAMGAFNRALAAEPRLESFILAIGDGMAVGVKKA
jgi:caffeoyl-CoA O-methyltransferase